MASLSKVAVDKPVSVSIIFIIIIALGMYALSDLSIDLFPEIDFPMVIVLATYSGTSPEEMEQTIVRPLESGLSSVSNIEKLTSTSSEGAGYITLEFTYGTNLDAAVNDIRDKIDMTKRLLPDDLDSPSIFKFSPSMIPILGYVVKGNRSPEDLKQICEDIIVPRIEQTDGVSRANISGGRTKVVRVEVNQNRLDAYNITLSQISKMLAGQNMLISAGNITENSTNFLVRTSGEYSDIEEIQNTAIAHFNMGNPNEPDVIIKLKDVANVFWGLEKEDSAVFVNGMSVVQIRIQKQTGTNSVKTAENVMVKMEQIKKEVPSGIEINLIDDTTRSIKLSINSVVSSVVQGALLAVIVLFFFLRSFKSVLNIGLAIPISVVITLMLMYFFNLTLNLMTLAGLALGVGMLVDNSIVVLENIYKYRDKGAKHSVASVLGAEEMVGAISGSTFTTICVFLPIIMFKSQIGMIGEMVSGLAFTVVISLVSSLLVAMFLVPVLTSKYLKISTRMEEPLTGVAKWFDDIMGRFFSWLSLKYSNGLKRVLRHKFLTLAIIFGIFFASLFLIQVIGFELMPQTEDDSVRLGVEFPLGQSLDVTKELMFQIETIVKKEVTAYKDIIINDGGSSFLTQPQSNQATITIILPDYDDRVETSTEIKQKLRKYFNDFPSAIFTFQAARGGGGGSATPIDVIVKTNDLDIGRKTANDILALIKDKVPEVTEPQIDLKDGLPQIEIMIDRDKAYSLGLDIATIGTEIRGYIDGITASKYRSGSDEYDILVIADDKDKKSLPDLEKIFVMNALGLKIPLANVAHFERTTGPVDIKRENKIRAIHITGGIVPKAKLNEIEAKIQNLIKTEIPVDDSVIIDYGGDFADLIKYGTKFVIIMIIALGLVFGVMAAQFESFLDPFIIMFTIPVTFTGVIIMNILTGDKINMYSLIGMITLMGIVVNNGIVLVDYANLLRRRGLSIFEATTEAGKSRLRPILMTTLTTILGLIPMAFVKAESTEMSNAIGKTLLGGLTVSSILTLFLVPTLYYIFQKLVERRNVKKEEKEKIRMENKRKYIEEQRKNALKGETS